LKKNKTIIFIKKEKKMKKLRTGIEKRIIYTDKEKNENIELSIKVITRLTDIKTDREIIFLNFDENNIFQNQFLCKIGTKIENISEKNFDRFFNEKEKGKFAYFRDVYIDDLVQIEITKENIPKIVIVDNNIKQFSSFYLSYDVEYSKTVSQYLENGRKVEENYKIISKEDFIKELNKLPEDVLELQKGTDINTFYYDTEIK
jgi:hypothetical protein